MVGGVSGIFAKVYGKSRDPVLSFDALASAEETVGALKAALAVGYYY